MSTFEEIGQEKQKIADRLARLDAERGKLTDQLNELEVAERVLSRFGKAERPQRRRPGRPAKAAKQPAAPAAKAAPRRRGRAAAAGASQAPSVSDAVLKLVQSHPEGIAAGDVGKLLASEYKLTVRPNHLGIALQRHRRAGRLDQRNERWFPPHGGGGASEGASA